MIATGKVDRQRIYVMGWSNGAAMALLYALNRPWVAAAAVYSAPDPFSALFDVCTQTPVAVAPAGDGQAQVFNPRVPLMHVRNDCDIGGICPNGSRFAARVRALGGSIEDVIIDSSGLRVTSCDDSCGTDEMADGKSRPSQVSAAGSSHAVAGSVERVDAELPETASARHSEQSVPARAGRLPSASSGSLIELESPAVPRRSRIVAQIA